VARRSWTWRFDVPPARVWRVLADTARFNEAAELPKYPVEETPQPDGSVRYCGATRIGLLQVAWEELPVNWVDERWFRHCRDFSRGPLQRLCASLHLSPDGDRTRAEYSVEVEPANAIGRALIAGGFLRQVQRTFEPLALSAREYLNEARGEPFDPPRPRLVAGARERARALVARIEATPHGHGLAERLAEHVLGAQEADLWSIRPLALARRWDVPPRHAVEVCLEAVKHGLLGLRWDLLCPRCRIGKGSATGLGELPTGAHCSTCNIDYGRDYARNVELAFHPGRALRVIEGGEYCLFGPVSTPHVKIQLTLAPGEQREERVSLAHGRYRLRTLEPRGETAVEWTGGGFPEVIAAGDDMEAGAPAAEGAVRLRNDTDRRLTLIVEDREWVRDALTAHRATTLQAFRDLFDEQVLRPGDDVEIDHVTLMFTDLKGSTALYERIGDPEAYALVREHYAIIGRAVREHDGAVVKTIGDAIMGAFADPRDALLCAIRMHADFARFNRSSGREPVIIKLGLHTGRCISVTLNNRLDYYGTAANKAARLEGQSRGGDVILSAETAADPALGDLLRRLDPQREQARLKGFEGEADYFRVSAESVARFAAEEGM